MASSSTPSFTVYPSTYPNGPTAPAAENIAPAASTAPYDSGLYVGIATIGGVLLSGTRLAPLALGVLSVGLIYQLNQLLSGKTVTNAVQNTQSSGNPAQTLINKLGL